MKFNILNILNSKQNSKQNSHEDINITLPLPITTSKVFKKLSGFLNYSTKEVPTFFY